MIGSQSITGLLQVQGHSLPAALDELVPLISSAVLFYFWSCLSSEVVPS